MTFGNVTDSSCDSVSLDLDSRIVDVDDNDDEDDGKW